MNVYEKELRLKNHSYYGLLTYLRESLTAELTDGQVPIRLAISASNEFEYHCEIGMADISVLEGTPPHSIFEFSKRLVENQRQFNVALIVPTGIGAEIGGHAGDATPVVKLLGSVCNKIITHPNAVNASDINEMPDNTLYLEGSVLSRLLMGTIGISEVRSNRILTVIENHPDKLFVNAAVNAINAAKASAGFNCVDIIIMDSGLSLSSEYSSSGTAVGKVENLGKLYETLRAREGEYDAVAITSIISVPREYHAKYFRSHGNMVNPWGGAEAIFTHTLSTLLDVPTAHSPMMEDQMIANFDPGIVDPRMAAEAVSLTFLQCILKGLHKAPKIVTDKSAMNHHSVITAAEVSCVVIPDGVLGLPVLAALEQGIKVIAVKKNKNLMSNDLTKLPWQKGQFIQVENYLEVLGVMTAIKEGLSIEALSRPLRKLKSLQENESLLSSRPDPDARKALP